MLQKLAVGVIVAVILLGGLTAVSFAFEDSVGGSGEHQGVENESFTVDQGERVTLSESELDEVVYDRQSNITVYNDTDTLVQPDGNWTWTRDNGTLVVDSSSGALANNTSATVTYGYREPTETQSLTLQIARLPMELGDALMLLFMVATVGGGLLMLRRQ